MLNSQLIVSSLIGVLDEVVITDYLIYDNLPKIE
jgi:hypothetical protein